jgi:hypothetical protein
VIAGESAAARAEEDHDGADVLWKRGCRMLLGVIVIVELKVPVRPTAGLGLKADVLIGRSA